MFPRPKRRRRERRAISGETRLVSAGDIDVAREIEHVIRCAAAGETRIVTLGPLVLCCIPGSAWLLDADDPLAYCLVDDDRRRPSPLRFETRNRYELAWDSTFEVRKGCFWTLGERTATAHPAFPARELARAVAAARSR